MNIEEEETKEKIVSKFDFQVKSDQENTDYSPKSYPNYNDDLFFCQSLSICEFEFHLNPKQTANLATLGTLEVEKLKSNISSLEEILAKLSFELDNGEYLINEECSQTRAQVKLATVKRIESTSQHAELFFNEIDQFEHRAKQKYKEMKGFYQNIKNRIKQGENLVKQQKVTLKQLNLNESEVLALHEKINTLKVKLQEERNNFKCEIFANTRMKFEANDKLTTETFLGKLNYDSIALTVK